MFGLKGILRGFTKLTKKLDALVIANEAAVEKREDKITALVNKIGRENDAIEGLNAETKKAKEVAANIRKLVGEDAPATK